MFVQVEYPIYTTKLNSDSVHHGSFVQALIYITGVYDQYMLRCFSNEILRK